MERPKVRFSQTPEIATGSKQEIKVTSDKGKVKIKSIVPINFPVKTLKNGRHVLLKDQKNTSDNSKTDSTQLEEKCSSFPHNSTVPNIYISDENKPVTNIGSRKSSTDLVSELSKEKSTDNQFIKEDMKNTCSSEVQICIDKLQAVSLKDSIDNSQYSKHSDRKNTKTNTNIPCITFSDSDDEDSDIEIVQVINTHSNKRKEKNYKKNKTDGIINYKLKTNFAQANENNIDNHKDIVKNKMSQRANKENHCTSNVVQNNVSESSTVKILNDATNGERIENISAKKPIKQQKKLQLMPCAKFREASLNKNKTVQKPKQTKVKKSTMFHVTGTCNNISVKPATLNSYNSDSHESHERKSIISKNLLSRPEYNSSVCVMKKLKEIEKQKPVTDFEHLPPEYKNLIQGKVSAVLDFPPYESVYKDLINLSVDDDKLPARLMRSKDPEPRDKDIVPELSDFYNPKYTEQYFTVANPTRKNPINVNTLSAFTISNKICIWKICRDNV